MKRPSTFQGWAELLIERLEPWARQHGRELPTWSRVVVAEEENGQRQPGWTALEEFEPDFQRILDRASRSWVNLNAEAIDGATLHLVVEYISRADSSSVNVPATEISVNLSGPPNSWWATLPPRPESA